MKTILLLLPLIILLSSCASKKYESRKNTKSNTVFNPYKQEWLANGGAIAVREENLKKEIVINFDSSIKGIGLCILREAVEDREILINKNEWDARPDKRTYITNQLLSACYGLSRHEYGYYHYPLISY